MTCEVCYPHPPSVAAVCYQLYTIRRQQLKKVCQSVTLSSLVRERVQHVILICDAAHFMISEGIDFDELMSSTSGQSAAIIVCSMKKTTNAIF